MRTLMIVDDEVLVRTGLQSVIKWQDQGYEIIGVCRNGMEAWDAIQRRAPDVLLTDIRMPECSGLELIGKIREAGMRMHILILSSHEEFQYLHQAMKLGVKEYILKHELDPEHLIECLNRLEYEPYANLTGGAQKADTLNEEKRRLLVQSRSHGLLLTSEESKTQELYPYLNSALALKDHSVAWVSIQALPRSQGYSETELQALLLNIQEIVQNQAGAERLGVDQGVIHALITAPFHQEDQVKRAIQDMGEEILEAARSNYNLPIAGGTSRFEAGLQGGFLPLRAQSEQMMNLCFYRGAGFYMADPLTIPSKIPDTTWQQYQRTIRDFFLRGDLASLKGWLRSLQDGFDGAYEPREAVRLCRMVESRCLDYLLDQYGLQYEQIQSRMNPAVASLLIYDNVSSWGELLITTLAILEERERAAVSFQSRSPWIKQVQSYIDEHYHEPLRLEDLAHMVNFSENYFSQKFHAEVGIPFSDYVTQVRVQQAKKLLNEGTWSTEEIADKVGYPNSNYFVRVFKKVTGQTLTEYRNRTLA